MPDDDLPKLHPASLDPLFTSYFFGLPPKSTTGVTSLYFPRPKSLDDLPTFFRTPEGRLTLSGRIFKHGVTKLLNQLAEWAITQGMDSNTVNRSINSFWDINFRFGDATLSTNEEQPGILATPRKIDLFILYTEGLQLLGAINTLIRSDEVNIDTRKYAVDTLLPGLLCAPGAYTCLSEAYLFLQSDPLSQLLSIRLDIASQTARELILTDETIDIDIHPESERHYVNKLLNNDHQVLGLEYKEDGYLPPDKEVVDVIPKFQQAIPSALTVERVIEQLLIRLNLQNLNENLNKFNQNMKDIVSLEHVSPQEISDHKMLVLYAKQALEVVHNFCAMLAKYGVDEKFNPYHLVLDMMEPKLRQDVEYYLITSLMQRLAHSGYLALESFTEVKTVSSVNAFILKNHSLRLSYVIDEGERIPFISYCIKCCLENDTRFFQLVTDEKQREELVNELLIYSAKNPSELKLNLLLRFFEIRSQLTTNNISLLFSIALSLPDAEKKEAMELMRDRQIVRLIQDPEQFAQYLLLYPIKEWEDLFRKVGVNVIKDWEGYVSFINNIFNLSQLQQHKQILLFLADLHQDQIEFFNKIITNNEELAFVLVAAPEIGIPLLMQSLKQLECLSHIQNGVELTVLLYLIAPEFQLYFLKELLERQSKDIIQNSVELKYLIELFSGKDLYSVLKDILGFEFIQSRIQNAHELSAILEKIDEEDKILLIYDVLRNEQLGRIIKNGMDLTLLFRLIPVDSQLDFLLFIDGSVRPISTLLQDLTELIDLLSWVSEPNQSKVLRLCSKDFLCVNINTVEKLADISEMLDESGRVTLLSLLGEHLRVLAQNYDQLRKVLERVPLVYRLEFLIETLGQEFLMSKLETGGQLRGILEVLPSKQEQQLLLAKFSEIVTISKLPLYSDDMEIHQALSSPARIGRLSVMAQPRNTPTAIEGLPSQGYKPPSPKQ